MPNRALLARHPLAVAGVVLATVSVVVFIALLVAMLSGVVLDNPYSGLFVFLVLTALSVLGLLLIPIGMWLEHRRLRHHPDAARDWFVVDFRRPATRAKAIAIVALTVVNVSIVLLASSAAVHRMESPAFCGQVCHTPMHPQFTAWQDASHSRVTCVQCHVGEGARATVRYKLSGMRQAYHLVTGGFPRPIPGVADMRPALAVCGSCHWSTRVSGDIVRVKREYADDEANTETMTVLQMHVGGPGVTNPPGRAIHWHTDPRVRIEYVFTDVERQTIPYVKVTDAQGRVQEYIVDGTPAEVIASGERRQMDCIDCHNTVAHRVSPDAQQAVNRAIATGAIDRGLPFIKREAVRLVTASYPTVEQGLAAIDSGLRKFYMSSGRSTDAQVTRTVAAVQNIYRRNVFPEMKVTFGTYPDNIGHNTSQGCFRCHDDSHNTKDGATISADCEYCHKQIETPPAAPPLTTGAGSP